MSGRKKAVSYTTLKKKTKKKRFSSPSASSPFRCSFSSSNQMLTFSALTVIRFKRYEAILEYFQLTNGGQRDPRIRGDGWCLIPRIRLISSLEISEVVYNLRIR